jgi:hypothetical protein
MQKILLVVVVVATCLLFSCKPYGKKVEITDNLEVYVKGEATEDDGRKLGEYIATLDSTNSNQKSLQLTKQGEAYTVRLVIPEEHINDATLNDSFEALQYVIKENVFPGKEVTLILTDDQFNDKKTVAKVTDEPLDDALEETAPTDTSAQ